MHCGRRYIILAHFTVFWVYLVWRSSCFVAVQMDLSTPPNEFSALTDITRGRGSGVYITSAHLTWVSGGVSFSFQNFQSRTHAYYMWFASICVLVNSNACHRTGEEHGTSATWGALSLDIILIIVEHPQLKFKLFFFFWKHAVCCTILYNYRSWSGVGNSLLFGVSQTIIFMCLNWCLYFIKHILFKV